MSQIVLALLEALPLFKTSVNYLSTYLVLATLMGENDELCCDSKLSEEHTAILERKKKIC